MNKRLAGITGGLIAGLVTTAVMVAGRKSGALTKTLDRDAVDWIDDTTGSRDVIGDTGTSIVEFGNHLGASAAFGTLYPTLREQWPHVAPAVLGAAYGTVLYLVNIAGIAPVLGITEGEVTAGPRKAAERWGVHVLQAAVTAMIVERLTTTSDAIVTADADRA